MNQLRAIHEVGHRLGGQGVLSDTKGGYVQTPRPWKVPIVAPYEKRVVEDKFVTQNELAPITILS